MINEDQKKQIEEIRLTCNKCLNILLDYKTNLITEYAQKYLKRKKIKLSNKIRSLFNLKIIDEQTIINEVLDHSTKYIVKHYSIKNKLINSVDWDIVQLHQILIGIDKYELGVFITDYHNNFLEELKNNEIIKNQS